MGAEAKLGRCPRCRAYALVDEADGIRLAIDIAPVDALGYGVAIASGVRLWWAENTPGRPSRVLGPLSGSRQPSWGPGGSQASVQKLHAEHSCGASARDMVLVSVQRPPQAPVTPGSRRGGLHRPDAPASATQAQERPSPAQPVTRPRSEQGPAARSRPRAIRCDTCNRLIDRKAEAHTSVDHDTFAWGVHLECP